MANKINEQRGITNIKDALIWLENEHGLIIEGHTGRVTAAAIISDNKYIISSSTDCTVRIWNLTEKRQEESFKATHAQSYL